MLEKSLKVQKSVKRRDFVVLVLLSAHAERVGVSPKRDLFCIKLGVKNGCIVFLEAATKQPILLNIFGLFKSFRPWNNLPKCKTPLWEASMNKSFQSTPKLLAGPYLGCFWQFRVSFI